MNRKSFGVAAVAAAIVASTEYVPAGSGWNRAMPPVPVTLLKPETVTLAVGRPDPCLSFTWTSSEPGYDARLLAQAASTRYRTAETECHLLAPNG